MPRYKIMVARFPFGNQECPDSTDWLMRTMLEMKEDPRIEEIFQMRVDDTPITMGRNRALRRALEKGCDYLLMLDSDMAPDLLLPGARPFWKSSWEFILKQPEPCLVAAPYCGPPPHENVYIFQWANYRTHPADIDLRLEQFSREEAARRTGFEEVGALPTGLILIDLRAILKLPAGKPWFYYEYEDGVETKKASTEDVTFTRDLSLAGVPLYVNWDAWAGHWKRILVVKPEPLTISDIRETFVETVLRGQVRGEKMTLVGEGENRPVRPDERNGKVKLKEKPRAVRNPVQPLPLDGVPEKQPCEALG